MIIQVCNAAFVRERFDALFGFLPADGLHFLGVVESRIVSHAVVTTRWLQVADGKLMRTAYVDAVATLPSAQGKGFSSAVFRRLVRTVTDYDIACLETSSVGFYARLGWQEWRGALAGQSAEGLIPTPEQTGVMILELPRTPPLDRTAMLTVECHPARIW